MKFNGIVSNSLLPVKLSYSLTKGEVDVNNGHTQENGVVPRAAEPTPLKVEQE